MEAEVSVPFRLFALSQSLINNTVKDPKVEKILIDVSKYDWRRVPIPKTEVQPTGADDNAAFSLWERCRRYIKKARSFFERAFLFIDSILFCFFFD
ncbi:MAG TPA: hypothetical protein VK612_10995 [Pyrinomonadaceae bacterium]|nr:hypothetical protein [Pyrinomonadaceae bacterium]